MWRQQQKSLKVSVAQQTEVEKVWLADFNLSNTAWTHINTDSLTDGQADCRACWLTCLYKYVCNTT